MSFVKGTPTNTLYVHISPFEEAMFMAKNRNRDTCRRTAKARKKIFIRSTYETDFKM